MPANWTPEFRASVRARLRAGETPRAISLATGADANTIRKERKRLLAGQVDQVVAVDPAAAEVLAAPPAEAPKDPATVRREVRDAAFWQKRCRATERELADAEHKVAELGGVVGQDTRPVDWLLPDPGRPGRAVACCLVTDIHAGEVVSADETLNLGRYDLATAQARLRRYFGAAVEISGRWTADCEPVGALLMLGGDLISGDIHDELRMTNALTSHEQVAFVVEEVAAGIRHLKKAFGLVHVVSVPGNHGRTTVKPTAKLYARLSYDTLIAKMLADRFAQDRCVSFQITPAPDAHIPVLGRAILLTHGDKMGTGGGQGFAGPMLPIVRGAKKVEAQQARANRRPDLICHGHYHSSGNPYGILANGSVPGYTEYGHGLRAALEPPQQWLFLMHAKWGLRERVEVQLEDPAIPALPSVRMPARMRERA
jgi:hypothetical protein